MTEKKRNFQNSVFYKLIFLGLSKLTRVISDHMCPLMIAKCMLQLL
jgi:hypothetical protein